MMQLNNQLSDANVIEYLDFKAEISLTHERRSFLVVVESPAGDARGRMALPFPDQELNAYLKYIHAHKMPLYASGKGRPSIQDFGQRLFDALLHDVTLRTLYYESRGRAAERGKGLRLKLRILPAQLAILPWEFLYDSRNREFVCLSRETPIVRYPELPQPKQPLTVSGQLRILAMIASPIDLPQLDIKHEMKLITDAVTDIQARVPIELRWLNGETWADLQSAIRRETWHIFHFIGHGGFDSQRGEGYLALADKDGQAFLLSAPKLAQLLAAQGASLRLVVLNACEGAVGNQSNVFSSTAATLMQKGIPAVLAMQNAISDGAALQLAQTFYRSLADGLPVDMAITEARQAMSLAVSREAEWGVPTLYMRSPDGVLFDPDSPSNLAKPLLPYEPETVRIPAGLFLMGSRAGEEHHPAELPQHEVDLPAYRIGKYPITNAQYAEFVTQSKRPVPEVRGKRLWRGKKPSKKKVDHPVVGVSWYDAVAYCQWLSEQTGRDYRLPTEAEWEKAARGTDGQLYPWGDEWDPERSNHGNSNTTPVSDYPEGESPFGCFDMVGNVSEWTNTLWGADPTESDYPYPYQADDGREEVDTNPKMKRIFRGGSFKDRKALLTCSARRWYAPDHKDKRRGFRVVLEIGGLS